MRLLPPVARMNDVPTAPAPAASEIDELMIFVGMADEYVRFAQAERGRSTFLIIARRSGESKNLLDSIGRTRRTAVDVA